MTDDTSGKSPFNVWWAVAGGAVLIVLIVGVLIISGALGGSGTPTPPPTTSTSEPTDSLPPAAGDVCDVSGANDTIPTSGPDADWQANIYFLYPTSPEFGPAPNPSSEMWGCFQKSPTGALFAAANLLSGLIGEDFAEFAEEAAVPSGALDAYLSERGGQSSEQSPGQVAQIAGFQFLSVTDAAVTVNLGLRQGDVEALLVVTFVWDDTTQNWLVAADESSLIPAVADLSSYTPWSGS